MAEAMLTAATTTEGAAAAPVTQNAPAQDAPKQDAPQAEQKATETQQAQTEQKPVEAKAVSYEFKAPEGMSWDPAAVKVFGEVSREVGLSQDAAQKVLDKIAPVLAERQSQRIEELKQQTVASWADQARADKEIGGDKLTANLAIAKKAVERFGTPELSRLLNETGLGNHPELIRAFWKAGQAISEDRFVAGSGNGNVANDPAKRLFPNMN